jgi:hypothetical protein
MEKEKAALLPPIISQLSFAWQHDDHGLMFAVD